MRQRLTRDARPSGITAWAVSARAVLTLLLALYSYSAVSDEASIQDSATYSEQGQASYYSSRLHGRLTASGERYDESDLTAAHPRLPFGTHRSVTNQFNGRSTIVRVNDRGPFVGKRIIDLSQAAARQLGMLNVGTARVKLKICEEDQ